LRTAIHELIHASQSLTQSVPGKPGITDLRHDRKLKEGGDLYVDWKQYKDAVKQFWPKNSPALTPRLRAYLDKNYNFDPKSGYYSDLNLEGEQYADEIARQLKPGKDPCN
jgi:hypothetical protein